jgi:glucose-6-phosphate 1-dehydrogenase
VRASEAAIAFKATPQILFNADPATPLDPNVLAVRIQPDEGVGLSIGSKLPGVTMRVQTVKMDFRYRTASPQPLPEAYERLLLDVMAGDATLFMRRDAVEAAWAWVTDILDAWARRGARPLPEYAAGSWGPAEADRLIAADRRAWRTL